MNRWKKLLVLIGMAVALAVTPVTGSLTTPQTICAAQSKNLSMALGDQLRVYFGGGYQTTQYKTSNKKVVTVDSEGNMTAVGTGKANVVLSKGSQRYTYHISVSLTGSSKYDKKLRQIAAKIVKDDMSDVEKVKAVHDYLITHTAYDHEYAIHGKEPYTAAGLLKNKTAVCDGYTKSFLAYMYVLGIPCKMVCSDSHSWNLVRVDKKWYQIDVTWDDPTPDEPGNISYTYFLLTDQQMQQVESHLPNTTGLPKCTASADRYTSVFALVCKNQSQLRSQVKKALASGKEYVTLALKNNSGLTVQDVFDEMRSQDPSYESLSYTQAVKGGYRLVKVKLDK